MRRRLLISLFIAATSAVVTACAVAPDQTRENSERIVAVPTTADSQPTPVGEPSVTPTPIVMIGGPAPAESPTPPLRTDWPRSDYHLAHPECRDRGFGGRSGNTFFLIDLPPEPVTQEMARRAVAEQICFADRADWAPPGHLIVKQAHFLWTELEEWYNLLQTSIPMKSANMWDMQEAENRIVIGLMDMSEEPEIRRQMEEAGIPQLAVRFQQSFPFWAY